MTSLRTRLIKTWFLVSLPPVIALGVVSLLVATEQVDHALTERVLTAGDGVELALASAQERVLLRTKAFSQSPMLRQAMAANDRLQVLALAEHGRQLLGVDRVTVLDRARKVIARGHAPAKYGDLLGSKATELDLDANKIQSRMGRGDGGTGSQVSVPIFDQGGQRLGTVLVQQPLDYLALLDLKRQFGVDFTIWEGSRLQATTLHSSRAVREASQARQALRQGGRLHHTHDFYFASAVPNRSRVSVLAAVSLDGTRALELRLGFWFALVAVGAAAIALVVAFFAARRIVRPVRSLARVAEAATQGDLETPIEVETSDEIGELGKSFRTMLERRRAIEQELREAQASLEQRVEQRTRELKESEEHLSQARRLEALGRLAGGVAHDFNNVLTAIGGNAELAMADLEQMQGVTAVKESLSEIQRGAAHAAELVEQLMAFGRRQERAPIVVDLGQVVSGSQKLLERLLTEDTRLHLLIEGGPLSVRADPTQVGQILVNLVVNAQDALREGGNIWVNVRRQELEHALPDVPAGTYASLEVRDDGVGMDEETVQRIFEPFFTTKGPSQGSGMGLATVHGIVKQNGAYIRVETEQGHGTCFRVFFPHVVEEAAKIPPKLDSMAPRGRETVLICEDDPSVRSVAAGFLESAGYRVFLASSANEARTRVETEGDIALLLTDVVMPEMNGVELARSLRAVVPKLEVIYMSGYTANVLDSRTSPQGVGDLLRKPFTRTALLQRVRRALDGQEPQRRNSKSRPA